MENLENNGLIYSGTLIVITLFATLIDTVRISIVLPYDVLTYAYIIQYFLKFNIFFSQNSLFLYYENFQNLLFYLFHLIAIA